MHVIADYEPENARPLVALWRRSLEHGVGIVDPNPIEGQLQYFLDEVVPQNRVRVAWDGSTLTGFLASTPESVSHLYVRVENIGQGVGTRLLNVAKAESIGSLWLYTFAQNANARRFYQHHGFREIERESENMFGIEAIKCRWIRGDGAA